MNTSTKKQPEIYELSITEIDDVAGAGWLRDAYNWVKKHVGAGPSGTVGISVKGTHDIGGGKK